MSAALTLYDLQDVLRSDSPYCYGWHRGSWLKQQQASVGGGIACVPPLTHGRFSGRDLLFCVCIGAQEL